MNTPYVPIDCHYHDRLLDHATLRTRVKLEYTTPEGPQEKQIVIKDVYTKEKVEYLLTHEGEVVRLDQIIAVNDVVRPSMSACAIPSKAYRTT